MFVTLGTPKYTYRLASEAAINFEKYMLGNFEFVENLSENILSKFLLRLTPSYSNKDEILWWRDRIPVINIANKNVKMISLIKEARLVVHTYNQTGFLECMSLQVPTILICNFTETPLREDAIPYYLELIEAGVVHESPKSAALHVNNVWDDIESWWNSIKVKKAVSNFNKRYCHQPINLLKDIKEALTDVS